MKASSGFDPMNGTHKKAGKHGKKTPVIENNCSAY